MAAEAQETQTDRDVASIAEARARRAKQGLVELAEFSQERIEQTPPTLAS